MKIALLSNVNADFILQALSKKIYAVPSVGYGDIWGQLLNPSSILNLENPDVILFLIDIEPLLDGCDSFSAAGEKIDEWFALFDEVIQVVKNVDHCRNELRP